MSQHSVSHSAEESVSFARQLRIHHLDIFGHCHLICLIFHITILETISVVDTSSLLVLVALALLVSPGCYRMLQCKAIYLCK